MAGVSLWGDGKAVRDLHVTVAAQRRKHGRVVAVEVGVVARAPGKAQHAPLAFVGHAHARGEAGADQHRLVGEPAFAGEAALAFCRVLRVPAMREGHALSVGACRQVDVVLPSLLQLFHVVGQELLLPSCLGHGLVRLVGGTGEHEVAAAVFGPFLFDGLALGFPFVRAAVDGAADVGRVAGVLSEQLQHPFVAQAQQLRQRRVLVEALDEHLHVHVQRAALLALDRPVHGIHAAKDATHGGGVAAESIRARGLGRGAIGAVRAEAHAKQVLQGQIHQGAEAFGAGEGVLGQHSLSLVVGGQFLGRRFA